MNAWSHLPNAALIDRILADLRNRPRAWSAVLDLYFDNARYDSRQPALVAARYIAQRTNRLEACEATWNAAQKATMNATVTDGWAPALHGILALIAWDHAGSYLDLPIDQIEVLAALGDNIAILIQTSAIVLKSQQELIG